MCAQSLSEPEIKMMSISWLPINGLSSLNDTFVSELNIIWVPFASALSRLAFSIVSKTVIPAAFNGAGSKSTIKSETGVRKGIMGG